MAADLQTGLSDLGGAVNDLFGASGARTAGDAYGSASDFATINARIAASATAARDEQIRRQVARSLGSTSAGVAGAGFAASGSALDILRSSAQEGALVRAVGEEQGAINVNSYLEQAGMFKGMQRAADTSATGQGIAGLLNLGGAAAALYGFFGGAAAPIAAGTVGEGAAAVGVAAAADV